MRLILQCIIKTGVGGNFLEIIFNADDFGYSKAVNYGIYEAFKNGVLRQATLLTNGSGFEHAVCLAKENPDLSVGVHLNLTLGKPLIGNHKTLVGEDGLFLKQSALWERVGNIDLSEVEKEWTCQIEKAIESGAEITSLDSHHFVNEIPGLYEISVKLAEKYGLAMRLNKTNPPQGLLTTDDFTNYFYGENVELEKLISYVDSKKYEDIVLEFMTHPGYVDNQLLNGSSYNKMRINEVEILTSQRLRDYLKENNIGLTSFKKMKGEVL